MEKTNQKLTVTINIIGAGKLGKSIAKLIVKNQAGSIQGICNSSLHSSQEAVSFIGAGMPFHEIDDLPSADITFITVPDDKIKDICDKLSHAKNFPSSSVVVHCSGLLTSDILNAARYKGCSVASIHPMRSFAEPKISVEQFIGTYCAIEGSVEAEKIIGDIFQKIGGKIIHIEKNNKSFYHAAGVIASNYLITLTHHAIESLKNAGIEHEKSVDMILNLMTGTLINLSKTKSPTESLTGPIKRGDVETIKKHMLAIQNSNLKKLYTVMGELTLNLTNHDHQKKQSIQDALLFSSAM